MSRSEKNLNKFIRKLDLGRLVLVDEVLLSTRGIRGLEISLNILKGEFTNWVREVAETNIQINWSSDYLREPITAEYSEDIQAIDLILRFPENRKVEGIRYDSANVRIPYRINDIRTIAKFSAMCVNLMYTENDKLQKKLNDPIICNCAQYRVKEPHVLFALCRALLEYYLVAIDQEHLWYLIDSRKTLYRPNYKNNYTDGVWGFNFINNEY